MFSTKETSRNKKVLATADEAICQVFVSGNEMTGVSCWTESCSYQLKSPAYDIPGRKREMSRGIFGGVVV